MLSKRSGGGSTLRRTAREWAAWGEPLERAPRHPDHTLVLADLDPELKGLPLGIPAGVLGEGEEHSSAPVELGPPWKSSLSLVPAIAAARQAVDCSAALRQYER